MIIVAGGDSFIWGSELADCVDCSPNGYSRLTYPAILATGYEYQCSAFPGNGNESIARRTMLTCEKNKGKKQFVFVTWTFHSRYEFMFERNHQQEWEVINSWTIGNQYNNDKDKNEIVGIYSKQAEKKGLVDFATSYFNAVGFNGCWQIYTALKEVVYLQNYLKVNNIPYLFTCADNSIIDNFYTTKAYNENIDFLFKQIDFSNWYMFPAGTESHDTCAPRGFYQWAVENKYDIAPWGHPLELAHSDAVELIREKFNELVKKSL